MKFKLFAFLLLIAMASCGENDPAYTVSIMSPGTEDKMVGDEIHLHINFDEPDMINIGSISVSLENIADGSVLYNHQETVNIATGHFEYHADVVLDVDPHTDYLLTASVWDESDGTSPAENAIVASSTVQFHVHPN